MTFVITFSTGKGRDILSKQGRIIKFRKRPSAERAKTKLREMGKRNILILTISKR